MSLARSALLPPPALHGSRASEAPVIALQNDGMLDAAARRGEEVIHAQNADIIPATIPRPPRIVQAVLIPLPTGITASLPQARWRS